MSRAYYNEIDPYAAQWLRNLIAAGHIALGDVDERSIVDVRPADLRGYTQCHFFAGVGVWSHALRLAGWSDDSPVWTGSCPCQPFSAAGAGKGYADERHLWPHWHRLIRECRPATIFGEQVDAAIRTGWLDDVFLSLEAIGYAVGAVDFPACSVGAPHIRQRCYFVADSEGERCGWRQNDNDERWRERAPTDSSTALAVAESERGAAERHGRELGNSSGGVQGEARQQRIWADAWYERATNGFWSDAIWLPCRDGKARATEPGLFPLAHGAAQKVGRLRAYGNAIVAPQASEFIRAMMEADCSSPPPTSPA